MYYLLNPFDCIFLLKSDDSNKRMSSSMLVTSSFEFLLKLPTIECYKFKS